MTDVIIPAPLWRRLAALTYDSLLLIALWMVGAGVHLLILSLLGEHSSPRSLTAFLFLIGLGFFGRFWTDGGQTLGMRVWRLQMRRADGQPLRWPVAATRYLYACLLWGGVVWLVWCLAHEALRTPLNLGIGALGVLGNIWGLFDGRRRSWNDILTATEVVVVPKPAQPSS